MIKQVFILFPFLFFMTVAFAQHYSFEKDYNYTESIQSYDSLNIQSRTEPEFVWENGIRRFKYVVARTFTLSAFVSVKDGEPVASEEMILSLVDSLNRVFSPTGMVFSLCGIEQISDPFFSSIEVETDCSPMSSLLNEYYNENTINMYFVDYLAVQGDEISNYVNMPDDDSDNDYMFFSKTSDQIISHTFGHFFGLYHTHESTKWGQELVVNKDNQCYFNGDLICDTPAEPDLSSAGMVRSDCEYGGFAMIEKDGNRVSVELQDSDGNVFVPSVTNYMSNIPSSCAILFTQEQYYRMAQIYRSFYKYLK